MDGPAWDSRSKELAPLACRIGESSGADMRRPGGGVDMPRLVFPEMYTQVLSLFQERDKSEAGPRGSLSQFRPSLLPASFTPFAS